MHVLIINVNVFLAVPRPVVSVDMCPLHLVLNQQTTVWFVDFVQGILGTIDFGLVSKVTKDIQVSKPDVITHAHVQTP